MFHPSLDATAAPTRRETFLRDGYVVVPGVFSDDGVAALTAEIDARIADHVADTGSQLLRDAAGFPVLMNRIDKISDCLFDVAREPALIGIASALLGKPALSLHVEYFAKPAIGSTPVPPHQDHRFYREHFDELAVSLWIPLADVDADGGALECATRSPLHLLPHRASDAPDFDFELIDAGDLTFRPIPVRRGDCIAFHSYTVHRVSPNRSGRPRRAVVFNYRGSPYRQWLAANA